jgi:hypothetical protein
VPVRFSQRIFVFGLEQYDFSLYAIAMQLELAFEPRVLGQETIAVWIRLDAQEFSA